MENGKVDFLAMTYVGSSKFGFYKDCDKAAARLKASLAEFDIELKVLRISHLRTLVRFPDSNFFYFFTRYGAGSWFWKPILIKHVLEKYEPRYLLYLDADCVILKDPRVLIERELQNSDISVFKQNVPLEGWISRRALRYLDLTSSEARRINLLTAGILLVRNSKYAFLFMNSWIYAMTDPRVLLSPIFARFGERHRHDQAVLSALVGKGVVNCNIMNAGFYSTGTETLEKNFEKAWVSTGDLGSPASKMSYLQKKRLIFEYYSRKVYDFIKSVVVTPIHLLFYLAQKKGPENSNPPNLDKIT